MAPLMNKKFLYFSSLIILAFTNQPSKAFRHLLSDNNNWTLVTNPTLPAKESGMAIGYYNDSIFILGDGLLTYHITTNTFMVHTNAYQYTSIFGYGQYYTQQNDILYLIDAGGRTISTLNLKTVNFTKDWSITANQTGGTSCLTANDHYLFMVHTTHRTTYTVLNLSTEMWITGLPMLNEYRNSPACVIHRESNELYVIGGHQRYSFEKIFIGNNINIQSWKLYNNALTYGVWGHRAVVVADDIWVIGGWDDWYFKKWVDAIQIIHFDTSMNSYTYSSGEDNGYLGIAVFTPAVILAHNVIYAFGGGTGIDGNWSSQIKLNTWQYFELLSVPTYNSTNPTIYPTTSPITTTVEPIMDSTKKDTDSIETLQSVFEMTIVIIIGIFILIAMAGYIDAKCLRINDFYYIGSIGQALIHALDMLSDCFLSIDISLRGKENNEFKIALMISIIFIVMPSLLSLLQVYYYSRKHWNNSYDSSRVREWLLKYSKLLYTLSIFMGSSFTAIEIMNSNIFGLYCFEMGLSNKQIISFKTQRIYSVVMLENIPQLVLQIWYMVTLGQSNNLIAISSAIFSGISIIVTILSMTMEKSLIDSQEYTKVTIDIIGKCVVQKSEKCKRIIKSIKQGISSIIGLDYHVIEVLKPQTIPNGLQLEIHSYVNNEQSKERKYDHLFKEAVQNGSLGQMVFEAWKLASVPAIANLKCETIESHNARIDKPMSQNLHSNNTAMLDMVPITNNM